MWGFTSPLWQCGALLFIKWEQMEGGQQKALRKTYGMIWLLFWNIYSEHIENRECVEIGFGRREWKQGDWTWGPCAPRRETRRLGAEQQGEALRRGRSLTKVWMCVAEVAKLPSRAVASVYLPMSKGDFLFPHTLVLPTQHMANSWGSATLGIRNKWEPQSPQEQSPPAILIHHKSGGVCKKFSLRPQLWQRRGKSAPGPSMASTV